MNLDDVLMKELENYSAEKNTNDIGTINLNTLWNFIKYHVCKEEKILKIYLLTMEMIFQTNDCINKNNFLASPAAYVRENTDAEVESNLLKLL